MSEPTPASEDSFARQLSTLQPHEIERGERLLYRLTEFGRILWEVGIDVGPGKMLDLVETLDHIDITHKEDFYATLKCSLLAKHEQEAVFDQMFLYYWYMRDRQGKKKEDPGTARRDEKHMRLPPSERKRLAEHMNTPTEQRRDLRSEMRETERRRAVENPQADEKDDDEGNPQGTAYSALEVLRKKDFESFTWDEVQEAKKLMSEMRWQLGRRRTHRKTPARRGTLPDMRRIVRHNLKYGAEPLELTWREIRTKPRPLVIICDISGSMSLYSRLLLHFIHTISNGLLNVEAFVFGTRLTRITRQLKRRDV
ncbi:MAG TPA: VWA domain-containing protein, partial [Ktedonobacteraceae bacterium]|nr:VWA domain-containing protein [Ktedonobacteraceae bacterium]